MSGNIDIYKTQLEREVISYDEAEGIGHPLSFEMCAYERTPENEIGPLIPVHINDKVGSLNVAVDGYRYDDDDGTLLLSIVDYHSFSDNNKITQTDSSLLFNKLKNFFLTSRSGKILDHLLIDISTPEYDLVELIHDCNIERIRLLIFSDREVSNRIKNLPDEPIEGRPVERNLWDITRLEAEDLSYKSTEPIEYDFKKEPLQLKLATEGNGYRAYIGMMPAKQLAAMYKNHGSRLLEGNVRSFLSLSSRVNKKIRASLLSCPEKFFILNNGIAATAKSLKFNKNKEIVEATDFQIVNGGQTTATIAQAVYKDNFDVSGASVVVKLTEILDDYEDDKAEQLIQDISRASNTQNPVSDADFFSNKPFHRAMELISDRTIAPASTGLAGSYWYYERARGAYKQKKMYYKKKSELSAFERKYPKKQVITKEALARVWLCWENEKEGPSLVSKGASALFKKYGEVLDLRWEKKEQTGDFGDDYWKETVALTILLRDIKAVILNESWYCKGYLANIATYTMAILADHVRREWGNLKSFDLIKIWTNQNIHSILKDWVSNVAHEVQDLIISLAIGNVTQWCKKQECWATVKSAFENRELLENLRTEYQIQEDRVEDIIKERKKINRLDKKLTTKIEVYNYRYWKEAFDFQRAHPDLLTETQKKALTDVAIRNKYQERTCKLALQILEKLRLEGFSY